jgi:hypothetical protein
MTRFRAFPAFSPAEHSSNTWDIPAITLFPSTVTHAQIICLCYCSHRLQRTSSTSTAAGQNKHGSDCPRSPATLHGNIAYADPEHLLRIAASQRRRRIIAAGRAAKEEAKAKQTYFILLRMCREKDQGQSIALQWFWHVFETAIGEDVATLLELRRVGVVKVGVNKPQLFGIPFSDSSGSCKPS